MKGLIWFMLGIILFIGITGCSKKNQVSAILETSIASEQETRLEIRIDKETESREEPEFLQEESGQEDGKVRSYLTGELMEASKAGRRPVAVMMSNDKAALPQYGINRAGVVYEAPVEGGMNRFMAILEDYDDLDRIGSVRSCRTYYTYFAREFDAIYAHFGQSTFAKPYLKNLDNINGVEGVGDIAFYRSKDKKKPHNAYTSYSSLQKAINSLGYSQEYDETYEGHYQFAKGHEVQLKNSIDAYQVYPGYSMNKPWFVYHEDDGLYYRFQYGASHEGDEGQIAVKNLILQYCPMAHYATTEYLDINVRANENGYYITNGKAIPIHWRKDGEFGVTHYYDSEDNEIILNQGKTWVCIIPTNEVSKTEFYGK